MGDIRVGGYGPDGCTCCIGATEFCPIHGTESHLSERGKAQRAQETERARQQATFLEQAGTCPICAAYVSTQEEAERHMKWHAQLDRRSLY